MLRYQYSFYPEKWTTVQYDFCKVPYLPVPAALHHSSLPISTDSCSVLLQIITTTSLAAGMLCSVGTAAALGKAALLLFMCPIKLEAETAISLQLAEGGEILRNPSGRLTVKSLIGVGFLGDGICDVVVSHVIICWSIRKVPGNNFNVPLKTEALLLCQTL